ncbi:MAG: hypothetical protein HYZ42_00725 [Bacteroidetes bacterium]|nr:hypothetical protein [Bacteroidota bacterium]
MTEQEIEQLIIRVLSALMSEYSIDPINMDKDTSIYGTKEGISSLMLVRLIVDLEEAIEIHTNKIITIADEKILSQNNSPFASIGALSHYLNNLVNI